MHIQSGTIVDERYEVVSVIGKGGMAVVYRVRHRQLGTPHALKVLSIPIASVLRQTETSSRFFGFARWKRP